MKWLWRLLGILRRSFVLLVVLVMLAFNVASFAVPMLAGVVSDVAQAVFGRSVVAELGQQVTRLQSEKRILAESKTQLQERNRKLQARNRNLDADLKQTRGKLRTTRAGLQKARVALGKVDNATSRIARRVIRGAGRNVAAIPMEAIPLVGVATVAAVTALDVKEACATVHDMQKLRVASGIDEAPQDWAAQVCGMFSGQSVPAVCDMTIGECRGHAREVRAELGDEMGDEIDRQCDALMRPDPEICRPPGLEALEIEPPER
ncbi:hypothetical protein ACROSR_12075 [Roseovarius tibetensis]|uniref:hypothetical protein n=1 Tax=Roseovarius tibetensis TaxID=2685897 RepID=UPI003D7FA3FB